MRLNFGIEGENFSVEQLDVLVKFIKGIFLLSVGFKGQIDIEHQPFIDSQQPQDVYLALLQQMIQSTWAASARLMTVRVKSSSEQGELVELLPLIMVRDPFSDLYI